MCDTATHLFSQRKAFLGGWPFIVLEAMTFLEGKCETLREPPESRVGMVQTENSTRWVWV